MSCDWVRIQMMSEDKKQLMAQFSCTQMPEEVNFSVERDESTKQTKVNALDLKSNLSFIGDDSVNKNSNYYIGVREDNVLQIHPLSVFKMKPNVEPLLALQTSLFNATLNPMTIKEQMEELKEKFGSRRTQRSVVSKRKYAIEFGEEDVEQIETKTKEVSEANASQSANESSVADLDILPNQNRDAICVEEVYDINEIITENERLVLKPLETELFDAIDNSFIKNLLTNPNDSEQKLIAIYINLIITLLDLKSSDLRKSDLLPTLNSDVKQFLFDRHLTKQSLSSNRFKYHLSPKSKDRLLIYAIILSIILHKYRPIDMELLQKSLKCPLRQLRRIVEIIGCYVENLKNASGVNAKSIVFRVPLNTLAEPKAKKAFKRR